ncbi:MAG: OmpH family outer membrane protein [Deltaproteobacteria bacterium]|nr:OmpH family outer membrane protein [Deltaproteobacteria bacterium]MBW2075390.1 OmpH family outer membrane protein [Deltaproteobacteria bacterium]
MKRLFMLNALLVGIMILFPLTVAFAKTVKIGVIDTQKIMRESRAAKNARAVFLKDLEAKRAVLKEKQDEVQAMKEELQKKGKKMSLSTRKEKAEKLEREIKELKRLRSDLEEELKKKDVELTRKLLREIGEIVRKFSKKEKYTVILEKRSVVAADGAIDITDKIIRLYDTQK